MFTPLTRAIEQIDDPAFVRVILASLLCSCLCFAALAIGSFYFLHHVVTVHPGASTFSSGFNGVLGWIAGALGGILVAVVALWLFMPVAILIASLFLEPICRAVERRWYPELGPPRGASMAIQIWDGLAVGLRVLLYSLVSLLLALLIPGVGWVLGWAITGWAFGRGLFVAVAMRRMSRKQAMALYASRRPTVLGQGGMLAAAGTVPLLNLLVPVLGTAAMVHVLQRQPGV